MAAVTTIPGFGVTTGLAPRHHTPCAATRGHRCSPITYRRRRMVALLMSVGLTVVVAQAGAALGGSSLAASERRPTSAPRASRGIAPDGSGARQVVVRAGDTLWAIAVRLAPGEDPRPLVDELMAERHGATLVPGETITIPA